MDEALLKLQDCSNQGTFLNKTTLVHMHRLFFTTLKSMLTAFLWRIGVLLQAEPQTAPTTTYRRPKGLNCILARFKVTQPAKPQVHRAGSKMLAESPTKAAGPGSLPCEVLKASTDQLWKVFNKLFNIFLFLPLKHSEVSLSLS